MDRQEVWVAQLGQVPYASATVLQARLCAARQADLIPDCVLILEHPPVYTKGRRAEPSDLPMGEEWYQAQGIEIAAADRGGRVTYHGPGQLVAYPIMRIRHVHDYVAALERAMISALAEEGIEASAPADDTGVWVGERKIGSIGVHVSRGVTTHGLAVNVDNDLQPFEWVVACAEGTRVTSIAQQQGKAGQMRCFRKRLAAKLADELDRRQRIVTLNRLLSEELVPA